MSLFSDLAASYRNMLANLMPRGRAWNRNIGSTMMALFDAIAQEFARFDQRSANLMNEADPSTALELLVDWERNAGLPDNCLPTDGTITERRRRMVRKLTSIGGQNKEFFIALAAQLGLDIEIIEFSPYRSGMRSGQPIYGAGWQYVWQVRLLPPSETNQFNIRSERMRSGSGRAGDRLRSFSVDELECIIRRAAPAHTIVRFAYPIEPEPILWFDFLSDNGQY